VTAAPTAPLRLCLIGMSGVGKSYWTRRLARHGLRPHDCDAGIAAGLRSVVTPLAGESPVHALGRWMGMPSTPEFCEREARYLALEASVTQAALSAATKLPGPHVIDCTGSVIYLPAPLLLDLRRECRVVYLRTPERRFATLLERYLREPKPVVWAGAYAPRPNESEADALGRCYAELLRVRDTRYLALADAVLDASELEQQALATDAFLRLCEGVGSTP